MRVAEPSLVDKVLEVDDALTALDVRHAFRGALALAYSTRQPRATADVNESTACWTCAVTPAESNVNIASSLVA